MRLLRLRRANVVRRLYAKEGLLFVADHVGRVHWCVELFHFLLLPHSSSRSAVEDLLSDPRYPPSVENPHPGLVLHPIEREYAKYRIDHNLPSLTLSAYLDQTGQSLPTPTATTGPSTPATPGPTGAQLSAVQPAAGPSTSSLAAGPSDDRGGEGDEDEEEEDEEEGDDASSGGSLRRALDAERKKAEAATKKKKTTRGRAARSRSRK